MKKTQKVLFAATAVLTILSTQTVAFAENTAKFNTNLANVQLTYEQKGTAPMFLFENIKADPQNTISLQTEKFRIEMKGTDMGELDKTLKRYDLSIAKKKEDIDDYHKLLGEKTPKNVLVIAKETPQLPGKATITLLDSSFRPDATVHVYQRVDKATLVAVQENIVVNSEAELSFDITEGGEYLVTTRSLAENLPGYDFARPQRAEIIQLLSYTKDDTTNRYLTEDIESLQDYLQNKVVDPEEELYFEDLWKVSNKPY